jgi:hypothetical protein
MTTIRKQITETVAQNVPTTDSNSFLVNDPATGREAIAGGRTRDQMLSEVPAGKVVAMGRVWEGDMKPLGDFFVDIVLQLQPWTPGPGMLIEAGKTFEQIAALANAKAAEYRKQAAAATTDRSATPDPYLRRHNNNLVGNYSKPAPSNAELNQRSKDFWAKQDNQGRS